MKERGESGVCKILIVGTGGLALWALRIAGYYFSNMKDKVMITVASLKDDALLMDAEFRRYEIGKNLLDRFIVFYYWSTDTKVFFFFFYRCEIKTK